MDIPVNELVYLSAFRPSDKPTLIARINDKEISDNTLRIPFPYSESDADAWFDRVEKTTQTLGRTLTWAIRDQADSVIGAIGFEPAPHEQTHRAELGYWLARDDWGKGIMSAVVPRLCAHAFASLGLEKINAHVFSFNVRSARLLERCGFELEGYVKRHYRKGDQLLDAKAYGLLKPLESL